MIERTELENLLNNLLNGHEISEFSLNFILRGQATEDSIRKVYTLLISYGLNSEKIASQAHLLGRDPETIKRNYQHHIGLLRQDYNDRNSGKGLLINYAQLLGIPPETIKANAQYLHSIGIDYYNGLLLGTKPQTKRKKMAWMLRELFDYREIPQEQKRSAIKRLYAFVRDNPSLLIISITTLEKQRDELRRKVRKY